ncbi:DUF4230 domain-containing protein [Pseudanabaena sp. ABRG5-3]|uniref:DUF4230 domain-containing protein n=1 Tax=Pseudanabaena sp. ABRG5-3 TaxID=685565 RepID=UPI000DC6F4A5|nr:DUF4230 domain-containing protein [Pseudanabaena sp. ABRG5-3]BBC23709.1 hypothetical protein ABRG53_1452 [Pseudanabaena sp. ABRG5-3]
MKWINYLVLFSANILLIQGCNFHSPEEEQKEVDQKILTKISQDISSFATLEASYSINYVNFQKKNPLLFLAKDNFYIRNDIKTYFYGYSLKDADIKVITENNQRVLLVKLPHPKIVGEDRFTAFVKTNDPNYNPLDEKGQKDDVEEYIKSRIDKATKMYEQRTIDKTREMSQQYFQDVADRFGLKLQLEFVTTAGSKDEQTKK